MKEPIWVLREVVLIAHEQSLAELAAQLFAQPRHRPVEVMQFQVLGARDRVVLPKRRQ